jgi:hypothetical protein
MSSLEKKLTELKGLVAEQAKNLESLSTPKVNPTPDPGVESNIQKPAKEIKPTTQTSNKDPKKMAEQLKNADNKKMAMDAIKNKTNLLKFNKYGQWSMEELDKVFPVPLS